jgi:inosine-uridine nucleoside N-ribohydrolase
LAVTVDGDGEVICPVGATRAREFLATIGITDVPVACGPREPLAGDRVFPLYWRTLASRAYDLELATAPRPATEPDAVTLLTETIGGSTRPVTLITLGPLTNLALALADDPTLADHIGNVVMMGGAVNVDGNVMPEGTDTLLPVEWNFYIDPAADAAVFAAGLPLTMVGLDATVGVPVSADVEYLLAGNERTPAVTLAMATIGDSPPPYLWDTLAAIATFESALVPRHEARIGLDTEGDDAGRTFADPSGARILVAERPDDPTVVIEHWVRVLAGLGPDDPLGEPLMPTIVAEVTVSFDGTTCAATVPAEVPAGVARVTVADTGVGYAAIVAHITEGYTWQETMTYAYGHPAEQPPMVDVFNVVSLDPMDGTLLSPALVQLQPGLNGVVCGTVDGTYYEGAAFTVTG